MNAHHNKTTIDAQRSNIEQRCGKCLSLQTEFGRTRSQSETKLCRNMRLFMAGGHGKGEGLSEKGPDPGVSVI